MKKKIIGGKMIFQRFYVLLQNKKNTKKFHLKLLSFPEKLCIHLKHFCIGNTVVNI